LDWKGKLAALGVAAALLVNIEDLLPPTVGLPLLVLAVILAWRFTNGFWKTVAFGIVGGAIAGAVLVGPGFRLAMRVVAIMDPVRTPEFSVGGTLFIIVGIGGVLGGVIGIAGNLIRKAIPITSVVAAGVVVALIEMTMLLIEADLREEFVELGAGPWVNVPMFGLIVFGYGIAAMAIAEYMERQALDRKPAVAESEKVPA